MFPTVSVSSPVLVDITRFLLPSSHVLLLLRGVLSKGKDGSHNN